MPLSITVAAVCPSPLIILKKIQDVFGLRGPLKHPFKNCLMQCEFSEKILLNRAFEKDFLRGFPPEQMHRNKHCKLVLWLELVLNMRLFNVEYKSIEKQREINLYGSGLHSPYDCLRTVGKYFFARAVVVYHHVIAVSCFRGRSLVLHSRLFGRHGPTFSNRFPLRSQNSHKTS